MGFDTDPTPPARALAGYTGFLLTRAFHLAHRHGQAAMPDGRIPRELAVLALLHERGPVSQRALSDLLGVSRTMMVKLIDGMERAGLVRRERDPTDRRSYAVTPTEASAGVLAKLNEAAGTGEAALAADLTEPEVKRLAELLARLLPPTAQPPRMMIGRLGYLLAVTHHQMRDHAIRRLRPHGLEPRLFGMLATLASIEPCSQQQLATEMGVTGPAVVGLVDELDRNGWIERARNPEDRREHVLRLTPAGQQRLAEARQVIERIHAGLSERLGEGGREELNSLLMRLT